MTGVHGKRSRDPEEVRLVKSGNDYFETLEKMIGSAREVLHFQMYIFDEDETGLKILTALKKAADRGVKIYMVLDAFGSASFRKKTIHELEKAGIRFKSFAPLLSREVIHLGRRLHHKVIIADHRTTLIGGINISNKYRGGKQEEAWLDYAVLAKGSIALSAEKICLQIMNKEFSLRLAFPRKKPVASVSLLFNDRLRGKNQISSSYVRQLRKAKQSITLLCSYFLPGTRIRFLLNRAAKRGVKVRIILTGVSDIPALGRAARHLYGSFLQNDIEIYEWNKSVLHGKLALVDDAWATVGSFNLNHLSALSSIEMNVEVTEHDFIQELKAELEEVIKNGCQQIEEKKFDRGRTFFTRVLDALAYYLSRGILRSLGLFPKLFSFTRRGKIEF